MHEYAEEFIELKGAIPVSFYQEGEYVIATSPALKISSFGDSEKEAKEKLQEAIELFFEVCVERGTLLDVLRE